MSRLTAMRAALGRRDMLFKPSKQIQPFSNSPLRRNPEPSKHDGVTKDKDDGQGKYIRTEFLEMKVLLKDGLNEIRNEMKNTFLGMYKLWGLFAVGTAAALVGTAWALSVTESDRLDYEIKRRYIYDSDGQIIPRSVILRALESKDTGGAASKDTCCAARKDTGEK